MPKAISHIALIVHDPDQTARLFAAVFPDARLVDMGPGDGGHRQEVHVDLAGVRFVLVKGMGPVTRHGDHVSFAVDTAELRVCAERLAVLGIEYQMARGDTALYFSDYDNHVFELESVGR
jgi:catechol 2,3-dioxygenase-like lactoylglutathione lyase family enzyme